MLSSVVALMSGCAPIVPPPEAAPRSEALAYWSRAVDADAGRRSAMINEAQRSKSAWKLAMLRSLPGNEKRDPESSRTELRALLRQGLGADEAALTRLRLAELEQAQACNADVSDLRGRLSRIVDIERQIEHGR
jgi:hypothetical protein